GSMNVGNGPIALMVDGAAQPGTPAHPVRLGETIGEYKLVKVGDTFAMVEYEGQEKRVEVQSSPHQVAGFVPVATAVRPATQQTVAAKTPVVGPGSPARNVSVLPYKGVTSTGNPDSRSSSDMFGLGVQDNYPAGTVMDGWKKVEHPWPFGGK